MPMVSSRVSAENQRSKLEVDAGKANKKPDGSYSQRPGMLCDSVGTHLGAEARRRFQVHGDGAQPDVG